MPLSRNQRESFWKPWDESEYGPKSEWFKPPDNATRSVCEHQLGVRLPDEFFRLLLVQNGGPAVVGLMPFMPLLPPTVREDYRLQTLTAAAGQNIPCRFQDLEWINEEFGNPDLIIPLESDGHCFHAIRYLDSAPKEEPAIIFIDVSSGHGEDVADSFASWVSEHLPE